MPLRHVVYMVALLSGVPKGGMTLTKQKFADDRDELRAEFTAWLDTLIRRAKLNYLKKIKPPVELVSLDDLHEDNLPYIEDEWINRVAFEDSGFNFEEERLANAYAELSLMRQQVLEMLFVDGLKVREIARILNCSTQYVSDQKQKGLKYLRKRLIEDGDANG